MVREGFNVAKTDKELRRFGMPMGPLELLDQVGLDVALHVATSLADVLTGVEPVIETLTEMVESGKLGKKANAGFYRYVKGKRGESTFSNLRSVGPLPAAFPDDFTDDGLTPVQRRLVFPMLAESIRCLEENVVAEPWSVDLAMVLGTGFAPQLGGPLHVVDLIGAHRVLTNMRRLRAKCGPRFTPPTSLVAMVDEGTKFFAGERSDEEQSHVAS